MASKQSNTSFKQSKKSRPAGSKKTGPRKTSPTSSPKPKRRASSNKTSDPTKDSTKKNSSSTTRKSSTTPTATAKKTKTTKKGPVLKVGPKTSFTKTSGAAVAATVSIKTYPVWVGNLHEAIDARTLKQAFSGYGHIKSCCIEKRALGNFGYVNFSNGGDAQRAAKGMSKHMFYGQEIKTKGPKELGREGHLKKPVDYRPLTDCSFGTSCQKGDKVSGLFLKVHFYSIEY